MAETKCPVCGQPRARNLDGELLKTCGGLACGDELRARSQRKSRKAKK